MPCVACTYMPNASWRRRGGKAQGRGITHPWSGSKAGAERTKRSGGLHKRSAEDCGKPLRRARAAPSARSGFLMRARQRTGIVRVALRQEQAAEVGSGECAAVAAWEETPPEKQECRFYGFCFAARLPTPARCPKMDVERVRTVLGCRNPDRQMGAARRSE